MRIPLILALIVLKGKRKRLDRIARFLRVEPNENVCMVGQNMPVSDQIQLVETFADVRIILYKVAIEETRRFRNPFGRLPRSSHVDPPEGRDRVNEKWGDLVGAEDSDCEPESEHQLTS